ncbi:MAG: VOC family protein [Chloroflexi bacterium]|nr:VOC family protein [Chloroflexota bacterium]
MVSVYDVGGVLLDRPFKIRRLGHFGFNFTRLDEALRFYTDLLGFVISDDLDFSQALPAAPSAGVRESTGYFTRYGTDHHAFVLFPREQMERRGMGSQGITINQITWQVGSLREVRDSLDYFAQQGVRVGRVGRDTPGSNWHAYPVDPDGHTNELYYGIEQVGWDGYSKPRTMYNRGFHDPPPLPQIAEFDEVEQALQAGVDLHSGTRSVERSPREFDVDGILLARPFKIVRIGPVRLFVEHVDRSLDYYTRVLGLVPTEEVGYRGHRCAFLRANTEHHSLALYPRQLRSELGLSPHTTSLSFGVQVANYRQLHDALRFLRERGVTIRELPPELSPGIDYSALAIDPDGHAVQLYYYMQQVGPDGRTASGDLRAAGAESLATWPATVAARSDTFMGEAYLGPWG